MENVIQGLSDFMIPRLPEVIHNITPSQTLHLRRSVRIDVLHIDTSPNQAVRGHQAPE
jgi:hypothetical protein